MEIVINVLIWIHLVALAVGGATAFGMPVVARQVGSATAESRPMLFAIMKGLSTLGRIGIGTLIVTGPLILWMKYGGFDGVSVWFWIKMVLVLALLAGVIYGGIMFKRGTEGDAAAAQMMPRIGMANTILLLGIVLCAAFAFS